MRHGFSKQRVNIYVMVWLKNYCDKKRSDRTSLNHRNVEYRIDQDGADLNFLGKGRNFLLSLHFSKESCASFCLSSHVFSFLVLVIFSVRAKTGGLQEACNIAKLGLHEELSG